MTHILTRFLVSVVALTAIAGCGGSSDNSSNNDQSNNSRPAGSAGSNLVEVLDLKDAPYQGLMKKAGYKATQFKRFPAQTPGVKASVVLYEATSGKDGGILYVQNNRTGKPSIVYHWYFKNQKPTSIMPTELNGDGLWDVRIGMNGGKTIEYRQDEDFTFFARTRDDLIATNGPSSEKKLLYRCFDGDSTSVWVASAGGKPWIDIHIPLGLSDGILMIQSSLTEQANEVEIKVDGKTVQTLRLKQTTLKQIFQLDEAARSGKVIRVVVKSSHGSGPDVQIAEISIR